MENKNPAGPTNTQLNLENPQITIQDLVVINKCLEKALRNDVYFHEEEVVVRKLYTKIASFIKEYLRKNIR